MVATGQTAVRQAATQVLPVALLTRLIRPVHPASGGIRPPVLANQSRPRLILLTPVIAATMFVPAVNHHRAVRLTAAAPLAAPSPIRHIRQQLILRRHLVRPASGGTVFQTLAWALLLQQLLTLRHRFRRRRRLLLQLAALSITTLPLFTAPVWIGSGTVSTASRTTSWPE